MPLQKKTGIVLRIERTSLHDGDGLRVVVFMKGCPLRCLWCSTPESQAIEPEIGFRRGHCGACGRCVPSCPSGAIRMEEGLLKWNNEQCVRCFQCQLVCPNSSWIKYGERMDTEELVKEIAKDEIFFFHSGGGVTFSGGEPLAQIDFLCEVMRECRLRSINTAVETSLHVPWQNVEMALADLNMLFADVKAMDSARHKEVTGVSNELILNNLKKVSESLWDGSIIVRIPVIPGINDDESNLRETAKFCRKMPKLRTVELLPYHRLGVETYRNLNRDYALSGVRAPSISSMQQMVSYMKQFAPQLNIKLGGGFSQ